MVLTKIIRIMNDYLSLDIPTVLKPPFKLTDIIYNCPVCDYEIYIDMIITENSFVICENCNQKIRFNINKV